MDLRCSKCQNGQLEMCPFWRKWVFEQGYDPAEVVIRCPDYNRIT